MTFIKHIYLKTNKAIFEIRISITSSTTPACSVTNGQFVTDIIMRDLYGNWQF